MNIVLLQTGYPLVIILKNDRKKYYDTLALADNGNIDSFITFVARAVERSLDLYLETIIKNQPGSIKFMSLSKLGNRFKLTQEHLNLLARKGKILAHKQGRVWVSSVEAIQQYLDNRERKGFEHTP
jgi:hypothetical protein